MNIEKKILEMRQRELQEEIQASKKRKKRVNINPDSLIGREIKYQTAILHEILQETKEQTKLLQSIKGRSGVSHTSNMEEKTIWYLCDGEKEECKKRRCYKNTKEDPCRHTKDINHAVNFKKKIYGTREVYRESDCDENNTAGTDSKE